MLNLSAASVEIHNSTRNLHLQFNESNQRFDDGNRPITNWHLPGIELNDAQF